MTDTSQAPTEPAPSSIEELNKEFRKQYEVAWKKTWDSARTNGTVILEKFSNVTLLQQGVKHQTENTLPSIYHDLKNISHIPLTIYLFIQNSSAVTDETLQHYWQHLINLQIPDAFDQEERRSAEHIISESRNILQQEMHQRGSIDPTMLTNFCQNLADDLSVLLNAGAIAHLNQLHKIIQDWTTQYNFNPQDPSVKVLLIGPRSNRDSNLQTAYFQRLLNDEERQRIIYTEELFRNVSLAESIFSRWFLDEEISSTFFNDRIRMHRDLLMTERAQQRINELFP